MGAAEKMLETIGARMDPIDRADFERTAAEARGVLDAELFERAWGEGRRMGTDEAVRYAKAEG
jgi:hypothetical protein